MKKILERLLPLIYASGVITSFILLHKVIYPDKLRALMTEFVFYDSKVVIQRLHVRIHLFLYITGKEAKIAVSKRDNRDVQGKFVCIFFCC